jgi:hypothetical protein
MGDLFGPIVTGVDVEAAVEATIKMWMPTYLAEVAHQAGRARDDLKSFVTYLPMTDLMWWNDTGVPACLIVAPGTIEEPRRRSPAYDAAWSVTVTAIVSAPDTRATYALAGIYAAALRALILQHPSLGGFASSVNWISERYDPLEAQASRSLGAGSVQFAVYVDDVTSWRSAGPVTPLVDTTMDPGDLPTAQTVVTDLEKRS